MKWERQPARFGFLRRQRTLWCAHVRPFRDHASPGRHGAALRRRAGQRPAAGSELQRLPHRPVHAVISDGRRRLVALRWGFLPHWYKTPSDGPLLINARAETIADKPAFRAAVRERRCLIPADGFYEWTKDTSGARLPWFFRRSDGAPIVFAGVWQDWERERRAAVHLRHRHDGGGGKPDAGPSPRPGDPAARGLGAVAGRGGEGRRTAHGLPEEGELSFYRVDPRVNSNRASGPALIAPLAA
jgi:putative SOS response-associated peptidase YedK